MEFSLPSPSPKQKLFMKDEHRHVGFGGARGGGKSFGVRLKATMLCLIHAGIKVMIVRKSYTELTANHIKPLKELLKCGTEDEVAKYNDSKKEMRFLNGSEILFRYCDKENDVDRYQGTEVDVLFLDGNTVIGRPNEEDMCLCPWC